MRRFLMMTIFTAVLGLPQMTRGATPDVTAIFPPRGPLNIAGDGAMAQVEFPAVPEKKGYAVVLRFDARLLAKKVGGWNNFTGITVNGKAVGKLNAVKVPRLLQRGATLQTSHPTERSVEWFRPIGGKMALMNFFAPADAVELDPRVKAYREARYSYTIDVSDLIHFRVLGMDDRVESDTPNRIEFTNLLPRKIADNPLLIRHIELAYVPRVELIAMSGLKMTEFRPGPTAAVLKSADFKIDISRSGGLTVVTGTGAPAYVESVFSYPAEPEKSFNRLGVGTATGEKSWKVTVKQLSPTQVEVVAGGDFYQLQRVLTLDGDHVAVKDTWTNRSGEDLGFVWSQTAGFTELPDAGSRLAGQSDASRVIFKGSSNPTVFLRHGSSSIGLVAEDTVSRCLLLLKAGANVAELTTEGMGIPAGKQVTLDWAIYPGTTANYFDFINRVRANWQVNTTIPGPYSISAQVIPGLNCKVGSVTPWLDYSSGATLSREQYKAAVTPKIAQLRKMLPQVRLLGLIENNLVMFNAESVPWGKELPLTYGDRKHPKTKYGQFLTPELTAKLDAATPYRDSLIRDARGNAMIDNYYIYGPHPFINLMVQPEIGNHRFTTILEQIDFLMKEVGFDGVYIDQFQPYIVGGFSENRWDGHTVELDKQGKIARKRYNYGITGASARGAILRRVTEAGGVVVTNGHPMSREEQNAGGISFQEQEGDTGYYGGFLGNGKPAEGAWQVIGHLATPVILGARPNNHQRAVTDGSDRRAEIMTRAIIMALRNGLLYYYYGTEQPLSGDTAGSYELCNRMFPFTPVVLGEGVLQGKERTITTVSGRYRVGGSKAPEVWYFNRFGRPVDARKAVKISGGPGAWEAEVKLTDWHEVAILVVQDSTNR